MEITCISDLHGYFPRLPGGDLLIVAGDLTSHDLGHQYDLFGDWIRGQPYKKKVVIAGNHDGLLEEGRWHIRPPEGFDYLQDSSTEYEGLKIYGSPWTPNFGAWSFMKDRGAPMKEIWDKIPDDTDILVTHGPPLYILDTITPKSTVKLDHVGCGDLYERLGEIMPKLHVFGHIHGSYGKMMLKGVGPNTLCVNASYCNEDYQPGNEPINVVL